MKKNKLIIAALATCALGAGAIPALQASADDETMTINLGFTVSQNSDAIIYVSDEHGKAQPGTHGHELLTSRGDAWHFIGFENSATHNAFANSDIDVVCASDQSCTASITLPSDQGVIVSTPGDAIVAIKYDGHDYFGENITTDSQFEVVNNDNQRVEFDGRAVLMWSCGDGTCYHRFDNIPVNQDGSSVFYKASTITADNDPSQTFDTHAQLKGFALADGFDSWVDGYKSFKQTNNINWGTLDPNLIIGVTDMRQYEERAIEAGACTTEGVVEEEFHNCVDNYVASLGEFTAHANLQPVGEPQWNNAYTSYGDRNFKVTIYGDDYRGVTIGSLDDLNYYPSQWVNAFTRTDAYDISGTSAKNPTTIDTILLEDTVNIRALSNINNFQIASIEALDVPAGAVDITKSGEEFKLKFHSNFYDQVVFKAKDSAGKEYYFRIKRMTLDVWQGYDENGPNLQAEFYFDRQTSWEDYLITAKIVYKDGSTKKIQMENARAVDDGLGNFTYAPEVDMESVSDPNIPHGKGLKLAKYNYQLSREDEGKISKVYFNVEFAGGSDKSYAGAFAGSGKGIVLDLEREDR